MNYRYWIPLSVVVTILAPILFLVYSRDRKEPGKNTKMHPYPKNPPLPKGAINLRAFLLMIQYAEGTLGTNAYSTMFGGGTFSDFSDHPATAIRKNGITSTAAGAYQFLHRTWMELQKKLQLPDFTPISQDKAATELIRNKGALQDVLDGRIPKAIEKCRKVWASFPGAGYNQPEHSLPQLLQIYRQLGGYITN